jgi:ubiquitin-protein ligase
MHQSPRIRRLRNDLAALDRLASESSVFQFQATGNPPNHYLITLKGRGLCRDRGKIKIVGVHRIEIKLGASYPRTIPEIRWLTPVYHPNISEIGMVCLGGYGTHWVPSVQLDELCMMLWDMARYHNYDIRSPYNRDAALWVANQTAVLFPTDHRPLRDLRVAQGRVESSNGNGKPAGSVDGSLKSLSRPGGRQARASRVDSEMRSALDRVRQFIERYSQTTSESSNQVQEAELEPRARPTTSLLFLDSEGAVQEATLEPSQRPTSMARVELNGKPQGAHVPVAGEAHSNAAPPLEPQAQANDPEPGGARTLPPDVDGSAQDDREVLILDQWEEDTDGDEPPRRIAAGEEIVFID